MYIHIYIQHQTVTKNQLLMQWTCHFCKLLQVHLYTMRVYTYNICVYNIFIFTQNVYVYIANDFCDKSLFHVDV